MTPGERKDDMIHPEIQVPDAPISTLSNRNAAHIAWCLGLALFFGLLSILCATNEEFDHTFGGPPYPNFPNAPHPYPSVPVSHPYTTAALIPHGCMALCLLLAVVGWVRGRHDKPGWFGK